MKLTQEQIKGVRGYLIELLLPIFGDAWDREEVIDLVMADVVTDIEETADWSDFEEDEVHSGDIEIALARVLKSALESKYYEYEE